MSQAIPGRSTGCKWEIRKKFQRLMLFNSWQFIFGFLPVTFIGFLILGRWRPRVAAAWLAGASVFFYGWWSLMALPILMTSATTNYLFGRRLSTFPAYHQGLGRWILILALGLNLSVLAFFKYANFFIDNANLILVQAGLQRFREINILLPIGISFFTFTQIAFLVDCWQGKAKEAKFVHYLLFVTYFPHLIAGPVLHHGQMMPQFANPDVYRLNLAKVFDGLTIFALGLAKKLILADGLADFVGAGFSAASRGDPIYFLDGWFTIISYTLQIYFDFSGYSDMAIGLSLLFGIDLPINFNSPYQASSIIDFWRRWHISLSTFLRDYLYIPLGGNRFGEVRRYINLLVTMVLGGLWHGASWNFILWGAAHGLLLTVNHLWKDFGFFKMGNHPVGRWSARVATFLAVSFAWVLFRAENLAATLNIYTGMVGFRGAVLPEQIAAIIPAGKRFFATVGNLRSLGAGAVMGVIEQTVLMVVGLAICFWMPQIRQLNTTKRLALITLSTGFIIQALLFAAPKEFMYFQF